MAAPTDNAGVLTAASMAEADDMARLNQTTLPWRRGAPRSRCAGSAASGCRSSSSPASPLEPWPDDVLLASFPKSGTTWLKALAFAVLARGRHAPTDPGHPLRRSSPHECVRFFERATHLPYHLLPERVRVTGRVVYVCRDPKDALVSGWLFTQKTMSAAAREAPAPPEYTLEEALELFCEGRCVGGPQWRHVLGYWEASRRRPDKVLFLRDEDMLRDAAGNVRRLAEFLGCPFSAEEEEAGTVDAVVELCSLKSLKASKASRSGAGATELGIDNGLFFRKGTAGDWRDHLTPEMAARLDGVVAQELKGSGFTFGPTSTSA